MSGWPSENAGSPPVSEPTPAVVVVRAKLDTLGDVKAQLARIYREAKGGKINTQDASRLANILAILARLIEGSELEARITALEGQA